LIGIGLLLNIPLTILWALAGTELPATILRGETYTGKKGGVSYTLHYRYAAGGQSFEGSDGVRQGIYDKYMAGDLLKQPTPRATVRYFGFGPVRKVQLIEEVQPVREVLTFLAMACFWNGILSVFIYQFYWVPWRTRRLCRWGEAVVGTLTECYSRSGRSKSYFVRYQFREERTGQLLTGTTQSARPDRWAQAKPGDNVTVLYLPHRPKCNLAYEFAPYDVA
jgi:hypothetical protein